MYVLPLETTFDKLCPASKEFYEFHKSKEYEEGDYVDYELDKNYSHFVALTRGVRNNPSQYYVISRDYFTVTNLRKKVIARRISERTVAKCYKEPNKLHVITKVDRQLINEHVRKCTCFNTICKIKKLEVPHKHVEYIKYKGRKIESMINYQGLDQDNKIQLLSDDWIESNLKHRWRRVYDQIMELKPEEKYFELPSGSRRNKNIGFPLKSVSHWTKVRFVQKNDPSCLFCSIASAMYFVHYFDVAYTLFEVYHQRNRDKYYVPCVDDVIQILRNNHRGLMVTRYKFMIQRLRNIDVDDILVERSNDVYYCVLRNRHVVAMVREFIFDSEFEKTLPRSRTGLRVSSETENAEPIEGSIQKCYLIRKK